MSLNNFSFNLNIYTWLCFQESEIYQKCIRPPPNRTVLESESPPPYRSHSAGVLSTSTYSSTNSTSSASSTSSTTSGGGAGCAHSADWSSSGCASLVVRCHSMSSSTGAHRTTPHGASSNAAVAPQKTDFLQRTVKILTGGGKKAHQPQPPPAPTLSVVVVPRRSEAQRHKLTPPQSGVWPYVPVSARHYMWIIIVVTKRFHFFFSLECMLRENGPGTMCEAVPGNTSTTT